MVVYLRPVSTPFLREAASGSAELLSEEQLQEIERTAPDGLTSRQIVDVFTARGIRFSEATLRKYVQLGLLPRSVRVGQKGKHQGSHGLYPANVVRRVNLVKAMMAENLTIEEIQRSFVRFKDEIDGIEKSLRSLMTGFEREAKGTGPRPGAPRGARAGDRRGQAGRRRARAPDFDSGEPTFKPGRQRPRRRFRGRQRFVLGDARSSPSKIRRPTWWRRRRTRSSKGRSGGWDRASGATGGGEDPVAHQHQPGAGPVQDHRRQAADPRGAAAGPADRLPGRHRAAGDAGPSASRCRGRAPS